MKIAWILMSVLVASTAFAVKIVGNGGDTDALEFVTVANEVTQHLRYTTSDKADIKRITEAVKRTKVESTNQKLSLGGIPKDTINYPQEKRILFNRTAWMNTKNAIKPRFVLHEYLGVIGVDDSSYALSTELLIDFGFGKKVLEVDGPFISNFADKNEYKFNAHVTIENFGNESWIYDSSEEQVHLVVELKGERKIFPIPARGHVISAKSDTGSEDAGLIIRILQPLKTKTGRSKEVRLKEEGDNEYVVHVIRDFRIEFHSKNKNTMPNDAEFVGPISNQAG